ncbi:hypothetical protein BUALT_Bualt12G0071800 [Buddleja alternifolia]|uniref:Heptahelical transmembrane protein 2-like n=1 Tax=Buddleja alternifolia TaxID=168488 RepID=A0AAV6WPR3_9LAMI|nr:hypothetical protein BUALT_Bualt12G0071800 [Buddleja alternifolia]
MKRRSVKSAVSLSRQAAAVSDGGDSKRKAKLMEYEELPEYLKDNEYKKVLQTFDRIHDILGDDDNEADGENEDSYIRQIAKPPISHTTKDSNPIPLWPWFVFLAGAMSCLIFSSISHLFACHSRRFYFFFWRLDYAGISLMIVSSFFSPLYYTFSDHPYWLFLYLFLITLIGILVVVTLLAPSLSSPRFRSFRAALFLCMGFSGVIPATHAVILHWDHPQIIVSLGYEIAMGVLYGVGAVFYVSRIPERWKPGAFDIVGHSHQIFHVFVVAAALAHTAATLVIMEWRRGLNA